MIFFALLVKIVFFAFVVSRHTEWEREKEEEGEIKKKKKEKKLHSAQIFTGKKMHHHKDSA